MTDRGSERDVAAAVRGWLIDRGWDVYQEVVIPSPGGGVTGVADLVALSGPVVWAIEVKVRFGLRVVDDALRWVPWAHRVSIAHVRRSGRWSASSAERILMRSTGIGRIVVHGSGSYRAGEVSETDHPRFGRHKKRGRFARSLGHPDLLRAACTEAGRDYCPAGAQNAKRWTPFRRTADALIAWVQEHPGRPMREAIAALSDVHHYARDDAACARLSHLVRAGVIPEIRCVRARSLYGPRGLLDLPPRTRIVLVPSDRD